jgi:hypothetical protein
MILINVLLFLLIIILILIIVNIIICTNKYYQKLIYNGGEITNMQDKQERLILLKKELSQKTELKNNWFSKRKQLDKVSNWLNNSFSGDTNIDQIIKCYINYKPLIKFLSTYDNYYNCYEITGCRDFYITTRSTHIDWTGKITESIDYDLYDGITGKYKKTVKNKEPPDCQAIRLKRYEAKKSMFAGGNNNTMSEQPTIEQAIPEQPIIEQAISEQPIANIKESMTIKHNIGITDSGIPIHADVERLSTNIGDMAMNILANSKDKIRKKNMRINDIGEHNRVIAFFGIYDDKITFGRTQVQTIAQDTDYKKNSFSYRKCIYTNGVCKKIEVRLPLIAICGCLTTREAFNKLLSFMGENNNLFLDFVKDSDELVLPEFIANYKYESEWTVEGLRYDADTYSYNKNTPNLYGDTGRSIALDISQSNLFQSPNLIDISSKIIHCDDHILVVCLKYIYNNNLIEK